MDKKDFDIDEIPKVEVYEDEVEKRKSSFSTWVLIAIVLLGGYYLWSADVNVSGSSAVDITDVELEKQVDDILAELEKEEVPVETDSNMIVKEFVEGDLVSFPHLEAVDPEGKTVSYSFTYPLNSDGEWQTKKGDTGEYLVTVTASDGFSSADQNVLIVVKANKDNSLPVLELEKTKYYVKEGDTLKINYVVSDADNDNVSVSFEGWMVSDTRLVGFDEEGTHSVIVSASDGKVSVKKEVTVFVERINQAPSIIFVDTVEVDEGEPVVLEPVVSDPENDPVTLIYSGWMNSNVKNTDYDSAGNYEVKIVASDGKQESVKIVTVIVRDVNRMPVFNSGAFN